ncbi:MAG: hypothetical protein GF411_12665 [Candidatus Lokiarchaeota archaeon]|nr:hypothetical protein [Candidatus Lokiarchaeota archaeon]
MFDLIQERDTGKKLVPKTMVYVITHGACDSLESKNLSEEGKQAIQDLARSRIAVGVRKIYTAPDQPSMKSAQILKTEFMAKIEVSDCLMDLKGSREEKFLSEITKMLEDFDHSPNKMESINNASRRLTECANKIAPKHIGDSIAFVTSPLISTLFHAQVTGNFSIASQWLMNSYASCAAYEFSGKSWSLVMSPDYSFLIEPVTMRDVLPDDIIKQLSEL